MKGSPRLYLVDTSALARAHLTPVRYTITSLITDRAAATCVTVDLAAGFSGRTAADLAAIALRRKERYVNLAISETIAVRAREIQQLMAAKPVHRDAGILDLLTAAIAENHGAVLVHYDAVFEQIATFTGQAQLWVAPRGSLEVVAAKEAEGRVPEPTSAVWDAPGAGPNTGEIPTQQANSPDDDDGWPRISWDDVGPQK
ncbi:MAG: PIN domain-containing protein [Sporichthyaceae bacterium]